MSISIQLEIAAYAKTLTSNQVVLDVIDQAAGQVKPGQQIMSVMEDMAPVSDDWMSDDNADREAVFDLTDKLRKLTDNGLRAPQA